MSDDADRLGPEPPEHLPKVRADALERAATAWEVRVRGGTWEAAAAASGYSSAQNAMRSVRSVFGSLPSLEKDEARRLWRDRLEALWRQALADAEATRPGAVTAAVRVAEAASRLDGLAEPQRHSIVPAESEIEAWVALALEASGRAHCIGVEEGNIFDVVDAEVVDDQAPGD